MATLLIENGPNKGTGFELKPGGLYTLGRDPQCDLVLHGELVSRQHCRVKEFKGAYYAKDLDSLNGIFLNDQRVTQVELKPGDKLQLGDAVLTFLDESLAKAKQEKTLGGYRLLERVGRGGMGTVYRAIQISLDREVAFKVLSPELVKDKSFVEQFFREARAAGQLNHPHIVQVYDVGQEGDTFYYSMEFVRGGSLEDRLREQGRLSVEESLRVAHETATALEYAELRGIVHRDIKPDNLMLAEDGRVRVADLGLALSLKSSADTKGQPILGTPHFISPEQALRRDIDIRSDIYSLGATLYRMLAGRTVFTGASAEEIIRKAVRDEPQPLRELNPEVPEKVAALVHRMLKKNPDERFASARELREALDHLLRRPVRTKALVAAIAVAVIAVVVAIVIALREPPPRIVEADPTDAQAQRLKIFEMSSEVDKRRIELEAVRKYLQLFETPRDRGALRESLAAWLAEYDYLSMPERDRARSRAAEIDEAVARSAAAELEAAAARAARVAGFGDEVTAGLAQGDLLRALVTAWKLDPDAEPDESARPLLAAEKQRLLALVREKCTAEVGTIDAAIDAAVAAGDLPQAAALCRNGSARFSASPEIAMPAELAAEFEPLAQRFESRRRDLSVRVDETTRAAQLRERERLLRALAAPTRQAVLALDFGAGAAAIEAVIAELETDSAKARIAPLAATLRTGQALLERFFAELGAQKLPATPPLKVAGAERGGDLVDLDLEKRLFKLRTQVGRATSSTTVAFNEFANADGLRQLLVGRLPMTAQESLDLAELMTVVEVLRWVEEIAPLAKRLDRYDPRVGWGDEAREGLVAPSAALLADPVDAALKEVSADQSARVLAVRTRARAEQLAHDELAGALDPFYQRDSTVGWTASVSALRQLLGDHMGTMLVQAVRPWIEGE